MRIKSVSLCELSVYRWRSVSGIADALQSCDTVALHAVVERFQPGELLTAPRFILRAHLEVQRSCGAHLCITDYLKPAAPGVGLEHAELLQCLLEEAALLKFASIALPRVYHEHLSKVLSLQCGIGGHRVPGSAWRAVMPSVTGVDFQFLTPVCGISDAQTVQQAFAVMPHLQAVTMPFFSHEADSQLVSDACRQLGQLQHILISQSPCISLCDAWNSDDREAWYPVSDVHPLTSIFSACMQLTRFEMHLPVTRHQVFRFIDAVSILPQIRHLSFGITPKNHECEATLVRDVEHHLVSLKRLQTLSHLDVTYWSHACPLKPGDATRFLESLACTLESLGQLKVLQFYVHWQSHQDSFYIDQATSGVTMVAQQQLEHFIELADRLDEVVVRGQYCDLLLPFARVLQDVKSVKSVCLHDWRCQADSQPYLPQTIADLGCLSTLEHLCLSIQWDVSDAWSRSLAQCFGNLQHLQRLELSSKNTFQSCFQRYAADVVSSISALPDLKHLRVEFCRTLLDFWDVFCSPRDNCDSSFLPMTRSLTCLQLSNVCANMNGSGSVLHKLTCLQQLSIVGCEFKDSREIVCLSSLRSLQKLQIEVDLHGHEFGCEVLGTSIGQLTALTCLEIKLHQLNYFSLSHLTPSLRSLSSLTCLNLCQDWCFQPQDTWFTIDAQFTDRLPSVWTCAMYLQVLKGVAGLQVPVQCLARHLACLMMLKQKELTGDNLKLVTSAAIEGVSDAIIPAYRH